MQTFTQWVRLRDPTDQLAPELHEAFQRVGYTIGGMMLFPGNVVDRETTLNGARGFVRAISDRMDLTLEFVRRRYVGEPRPLAATIARYEDFFALFGTFRHYVEFFLLQRLVDPRTGTVRFFIEFDDFRTPPCRPMSRPTWSFGAAASSSSRRGTHGSRPSEPP